MTMMTMMVLAQTLLYHCITKIRVLFHALYYIQLALRSSIQKRPAARDQGHELEDEKAVGKLILRR